MSWKNVCEVSQVKEDFPFSANIEGKEVGVYLIDGQYYALEEIFEQGAEELEQIVSALNQRRLFDRSGQPWNEATFREFLHVNGF